MGFQPMLVRVCGNILLDSGKCNLLFGMRLLTRAGSPCHDWPVQKESRVSHCAMLATRSGAQDYVMQIDSGARGWEAMREAVFRKVPMRQLLGANCEKCALASGRAVGRGAFKRGFTLVEQLVVIGIIAV